MKKNYLKKLMCAVLTAVCIVTTVVPNIADDSVVTAEAATKSVTSAYKYHLRGFDKKGYAITFSKNSFYKDLNSLPVIKTGKTTINVPAVTSSVKSVSKEKNYPIYKSFVKFKAPKTGKYVFTCTNLQCTDNKSVKELNCNIDRIEKIGKKYSLEDDLYPDTVGDYEMLYENNFLEKLRVILDNYAMEHPDYEDILNDDYNNQVSFVNKFTTTKMKFTTKLKKGQTYVFVIDNSGKKTTCAPYNTSFYDGSMSCLYNSTDYKAAYSFDLDIQFKK